MPRIRSNLMPAAADDQALEPLLPRHEHGRRHSARPPGQDADQRDVAADARGPDRLRQRARATHFNDVIHADAAGQLPHPVAPSLVLAVVDAVGSAHGAKPLQLLVGGGGRDDRGPHGPSDLQRKD